MKKTITLFFSFLVALAANSQTTVYTTGQSYTDPWTGWSTPVVTGITSQSVNGANIYNFNGMASTAFTVEIYRQFTIYTNDMDLYLAATTQNATVSVEFSTDNVSYTEIGTQNWGAGLALSTIVIPTYDPVVSTFYLKLKMVGTFASPSQTNFNNLKIDAVVTGVASAPEFVWGESVLFADGQLQIKTAAPHYEVAIVNMNGQVIATEKNLKSFDFGAYQPGIYFVAILHEGTRKTMKIAHVK